MNISIMSQEQAIFFKPDPKERTAIIRIHDPEQSVMMLKNETSFIDELYVFFHDVRKSINGMPDYVKEMSLLDAKRILAFASNHRDADTLIIHCHAGVSRSASVALGVSWLLKMSDVEEMILTSDDVFLNRHIISLFAEILGIRRLKGERIRDYYKEIERKSQKNSTI